MLQGLRAGDIRRAMAVHELSQQSVDRHMRAIREGWAARNTGLEERRAEMVAQLEADARVALTRATVNADNNRGVGYMNVHLKAMEQLARLLGLDAPRRTELTGRGGGPVELRAVPHELDGASPEQARAYLERILLEIDGGTP